MVHILEQGFYKKDKAAYERDYKITGGLWGAYKLFKYKYPKHNVSRTDYVKICHLINKKISNAIVTDSLEFRVPYRLGFIRIKTFKQQIKFIDGKLDTQSNSIDWVKTKKLWAEQYPELSKDELKAIKNKQLVIHVNDHSNGYTMRWMWDKRFCTTKNKTVYVFSPVKGGITKDDYHYGRRGLASWIKNDENNNEYYK